MYPLNNVLKPSIDIQNPIHRRHPLSYGLLAFYLCHQGIIGGNKLYDLVGSRCCSFTSFTNPNTSGWRRSPFTDGSIAFNGTSYLVSDVGKTFTLPLSFAMLIRPSAFAADCVLCLGNSSIRVILQTSTNIRVTMSTFATHTVPTLIAGNYYFIAGSLPGPSLTSTLYVKNITTNSYAFVNGTLSTLGSVPDRVAIGATNAGATGYSGNVDAVIVWDRTITRDEMVLAGNLAVNNFDGWVRRNTIAIGSGVQIVDGSVILSADADLSCLPIIILGGKRYLVLGMTSGNYPLVVEVIRNG